MPPLPKVFISATSADLGGVRQIVKDALITIGCHPVEQTNFPPDARTVAAMLRGKIGDCQALIHIAGMRYGAEPDPSSLAPDAPRHSYTQLEYLIARSLQDERGDKHFRVYTFICPAEFPYNNAAPPEPEEKSRLQSAHRARLFDSAHIHQSPGDIADLTTRIHSLQENVHTLRIAGERNIKRVLIASTSIFLLLCGIAGGIFHLTGRTNRIQSGQNQLASDLVLDRLTDRTLVSYQDRFRSIREQNKNIPNSSIDAMVRAELPSILNADAATVKTILETEAPRLAAALDTPISKKLSALFVMGSYEIVIAEGEKKIAEPAIDSLQTMGDAARAIFEKTPDRRHLETTLRYYAGAAALMDKEIAPLPWAEMQIWVSRTLHELGRYAEAEPIVRAALAIRKKECGVESPEYASAANNLGTMLDDLERYEEAEPLLREVFVASESIYGKDHPSVAISLSNLAILLGNTNRLVEAEEMLRRAVAIDEAYFGKSHEAVARDLSNLAETLSDADRHADAEPLMRRAIEIVGATMGEEHPSHAIYSSNLGRLLAETGRAAEAEPLFRKALVVLEKSLGIDHIDVAAVCNNLGHMLENEGRWEEAEALFDRTVKITQAAFGDKSARTIKSMLSHAIVLKMMGRDDDAEVVYRRILAINEAALGTTHPDVGRDLNNVGGMLFDKRNVKEAEPLFRRAVAILDAHEKEVGVFGAVWLSNLAHLLRFTRRFEESEANYRRAIAIQEAGSGKADPALADRLNNLAELLKECKRTEEAKPLYQRAIEITENAPGDNDLALVHYLENCIAMQMEAKQTGDIMPYIEKALKIREAEDAKTNHPRTQLLIWKSKVLMGQKQYKEAEPILRRLVSIYEDANGPDDVNTIAVKKQLEVLLEKMKK